MMDLVTGWRLLPYSIYSRYCPSAASWLKLLPICATSMHFGTPAQILDQTLSTWGLLHRFFKNFQEGIFLQKNLAAWEILNPKNIWGSLSKHILYMKLSYKDRCNTSDTLWIMNTQENCTFQSFKNVSRI